MIDSERIGPYRLIAPLGRGGIGIVYRAWHEATGDIVALKTVRAADVRSLATLRREIHALTRLSHPGIARVLDTGEADGIPWYAMALCEGITLRRLQAAKFDPQAIEWWTEALDPHASDDTTAAGIASWADDPTHAEAPSEAEVARPRVLPRLPLTQALLIVRRLCDALAYMHGEGVVHRDLKPENLIVQGEDRPIIVDFGLAATLPSGLSREDLSEATEAAGTVTYMAPEQTGSDLVDARADLYSLGCILYELVTGRPPFFGESPVEVLAKHMTARPAPPSSISHGISRELDELVLRLLEKRPSDRIGYADVIAARLDSILKSIDPELRREEREERPRPYLYRPGFSGRETILSRLQEVIAASRRGKGRLVLLPGESGSGKTRLLLALVAEARTQRITVLTGDCPPGVPQTSGGTEPLLEPLRPTLQHVHDRCLERGREETERLLGRRGPVLAAFEPSLAALPGQDTYPAPPEIRPAAARQRLFADLADTLAALSGDRPLMLLLDDLQWADELTVGFLEHLARSGFFERLSIVIFGTYRSEETSASLDALRACADVLTLEVTPLRGNAVASIAAGMLASTPDALPEGFVPFLESRSDGNPFFVAEYLRAAVQEGLLVRDARGRWNLAARQSGYEHLPIPGSLRSLVGRRLLHLPPSSVELLQIASVFGRDVDGAILMEAIGLDEQALFEALAPLLQRHVLEDFGYGGFRFVHDKLREAAYAAIPGASRASLHQAAALVLERHGSSDDADLARLASHWEIAGEASRARDYYLRAARHAVKSHAPDEAERLYRAFLFLAPEPSPETIAARSELAAKVLQLRGRDKEAFAEHKAVLQQSRVLGDKEHEATSLRHMGDIENDTGHVTEGHALYEEALNVARGAGLRSLEGGILNSIATRFARQGREEEALTIYRSCLSIAREVGDRKVEGGITGNMGNAYWNRRELLLARLHFEKALAIQQGMGDERGIAITLGNLSGIYQQEDPDKAREIGRKALQLHRAHGDRHMEVLTLANTSQLEPDPKTAIAMLQRALALAHDMAERAVEGHILGNLGHVHRQLGDLAAAERYYCQGLAIAGQVREPRQQALILSLLASLAGQRSDVPRARKLYEESLALYRGLGHDLEVKRITDALGELDAGTKRP